MISKLKKLFSKKESKPLIVHKCSLCKQDIKIKHLKNNKCCEKYYHDFCYNKWKYMFGMKPCCFNHK